MGRDVRVFLSGTALFDSETPHGVAELAKLPVRLLSFFCQQASSTEC
jgi:hypothetical protein